MAFVIKIFLSLLIIFYSLESFCQKTNNDYLIRVCDSTYENCGYINSKGDTVIPIGKYLLCQTDTFKNYAIVTIPNKGLVAIDRNEKVIYNVFIFDNGPDYVSDGLFRIVVNNKIGYADYGTGKITINPQFDCARPFENGVAEVGIKCEKVQEGEYYTWASDHWFYIDKKGNKVKR